MILLVGGTGFLGRHICEAIERAGLSACTISRTPDTAFLAKFAPSVRGIPAESKEAEQATKSASVVIYLAHRSRPGSSPDDPTGELNGNVSEAARFFTRLRETNPTCHTIYMSSGGQLYGHGHTTPIPEHTPTAPPTSYAFGKLLIENTLHFLTRTTPEKLTILRLANPVGRWQMRTTHGFVAAAVRAAIDNTPLTVFGDGNNQRDYFDADDFANYVVKLIEQQSLRPGTFNIGSGTGLAEREVIAAIETSLASTVTHTFAPARPFDLPYAVLDVRLAREQLGWKPKCSLAQTIAKLSEQAE